jgi:hypothetical protein
MRRQTTDKDFWEKVDKNGANGCWQWLGSQNGSGYAQYWIDGKHLYVHRYAYNHLVGEIPKGMVLDHLCRNRVCVNPAHLEMVTQQENILRGIGKAAKESMAKNCPQGHPYDEQNTILYQGRRYCRECGRTRTNDYHRRLREIRDAT